MKYTTIRISSGLLEDIKLVKKATGAMVYEDVLADLVKDKLMQTHAYTKDGYLAVGSVVSGEGISPSIIVGIESGKVILNNHRVIINGGTVCYGLDLLAGNVDTYTGGPVDE